MASAADHTSEDICAGFATPPCRCAGRLSFACRPGRRRRPPFADRRRPSRTTVRSMDGRVKEDKTPMAWKRRRPTWPYLAILCFLFALSRRGAGVVASSPCRSRLRTGRSAAPGDESASDEAAPRNDKPAAQEADSTRARVAAAGAVPLRGSARRLSPGPSSPSRRPQARRWHRTTTLAVDEPLVEPTPGGRRPRPGASGGRCKTPPSAVAESFASRPGGRSVLVRRAGAHRAERDRR